ncbi:MAG: pitrilysin family protein [Clostridiales bacterium]|nr:pitrilysin family protein [Clostridiales bacterium]
MRTNIIKIIVVCCGLVLLLAPASLAQERFRKSAPIPEPLGKLRLPSVESVRLSNGLSVAAVFENSHPFISLELVIQTGESSSPPELPGLASFTAEMINRGTVAISAADIEERVEFIGGSLTTTVSLDQTRFSFIFLDEYLDQALDLLSQMVLQPAFTEREIVNVKRIQFYDFLEKRRDQDQLARRQLLRLLFKGHPYARGFYNEDVIKNISRKDVLAFFQATYRPNNAIIVLTGNLNLATASRKVSHYFNTWRKSELERPALTAPLPNTERRVCFVDLPQAKDVTLFLGNVIFPLDDPDYFAFSVLNQVLGGALHSRLFMNLRETRQLAYFAFSEIEFFRCCGVYAVKARVRPSACHDAVQEILKELDRIARERVSTFELEQAKSYLIGNFPILVEKLDDLAACTFRIATHSLGSAYWGRFYESVMGVDAERVYDVARKYLLHPPVIVIVGDRSVVIDFIDRFEKIEVFDAKGEYRYTLTKGVVE